MQPASMLLSVGPDTLASTGADRQRPKRKSREIVPVSHIGESGPRAGDVARLVESLPSKHKALGLLLSLA